MSSSSPAGPRLVARPQHELRWGALWMSNGGGSLYVAAVVVSLSDEQLGAGGFCVVAAMAGFFALPLLVFCAVLLGQTLAQRMAERVRSQRVPVFAMAGCALGLALDPLAGYIAFRVVPGIEWPRDLQAWLVTAAAATVIPAYTMLWAAITALQFRNSPRAVSD